MINEEFRRIERGFKDLRESLSQPDAPTATAQTASTGDSVAPIVKPKLSIQHNGVTVITNVTDIIDFEDNSTVRFDVIAVGQGKAEVRANAARGEPYTARRIGEILYSLDGRVFTPQWPLTDPDAGILLTDDGIIMIAG